MKIKILNVERKEEKMKLNKTLENLKNGMTIRGEKELEKILNFKAVKSITREYNYVVIHLVNGEEIEAKYSDIIY